MSKNEIQGFMIQMPSDTPHHPSNLHASSLPSTPYQHARKLSFDSISPAPDTIHRAHSPRSIYSESDSTRTARKVPFAAGCKYETGMAYSRRRIPYSLGGDMLDRPEKQPIKYLNPKEEDKLSGDMRELYDRLLPSAESEERRAIFVQKLESLLNKQWPGSEIKVHVFGSSGNMLCTSDSDVDICITTSMKELEHVCLLANALAEHGMERVVCVRDAKVPIVKIWDPELHLACDMNVNNTLALENTRMIKTYVEIDPRVRPVAMIVKHWTKTRILNDAALGGTLSSYTWICMIINFLQTRNPPVLPALHKRPHQRQVSPGGKQTTFADDIMTLRGFGAKNRESIGDLLFHFYRFYGHEVDFEKDVVSVREGKLISKEEKRWHLMQNNRLCIEEPFNTERNLGNTADDISFRGLHLELRRAFDLICDAELGKCCEPYVFPAIEEKIWEKPPPQPRPILSRSASQSGKGGRGSNGSRGGKNSHSNHQHRAGGGNRRASSAATFNKPTISSNSSQGAPSREQAQYQLHNELYHHYQLLQAQEQELRTHLVQQAQGQLQVQAVVQTRSQTQPQSHPQSYGPRNRQTSRDCTGALSNDRGAPTAPPKPAMLFYPFPVYQVHNPPQHGIHTNPSSPSMSPRQPELRRGLHRSSAAAGPDSPNSRSQSQPARSDSSSLPFHGFPIPGPYLGPVELSAAHPSSQYPSSYIVSDPNQQGMRSMNSLRPHHPRTFPYAEDGLPKEYIGYYVHGSPTPRQYTRESIVAPTPTHHDLQHRFRAFSPGLSRLRQPSRSPSPSSAYRDRSFSIRSAVSAPSSSITDERVQYNGPRMRRDGPIIVNGSDGFDLPDFPTNKETSYYATTASESTSASDEHLEYTPATTSETPSQESGEPLALDLVRQISQAQPAFDSWPRSDAQSNGLLSSSANATPVTADAIPSQEAGAIISLHQPESFSASTNGLGIAYDNSVADRTPTNASTIPSQENDRLSTFTPKLDFLSDTSNPRLEATLKPLPLLSPVREVRTPSPIVNRKDENTKTTLSPNSNGLYKPSDHVRRQILSSPLVIPPFRGRSPQAALSHGRNGHPNDISSVPKEHDQGNGGSRNSPARLNGHVQGNGWQQQSGKRSNRKKHKANTPSMTALTQGEPVPSSETERKGG